ncbi:ABC transporter substrate-binding protein [Ruminiclostridium cellobioparum]|uniref:ABC-type sugar transport system, periplasmic component n=1 Tax=Ruminiclostridium cellobioparum subsp. termitidis CT1112 TaxID=1195236 RepID=S0FHP3_RUMCE|nr:sugar ABC transporter substrate-binding protein [Ruminiclostridium cellobioparum]EMS71012.1 ABC-type sugar transport system, periplasmic component [Ruminiclostridium cellobioparum subsp. termitidis CT1112]
MKNLKKFKIISLVLCLTILTVLFAACGSSQTSDSGTSTAAGTNAASTTSGGDSAKAPVTGEIKYNFWGNADQAKAIQAQIDSFTAKNPGIKVNLDFADWGNYWTKLATQSAAGSAPDVFAMSTTLYLADYANKGYLVDVGELAGKDNFDLNKYYKSALDLSSYNGKVYGLPQDINTIILAYNTDMFEKAGLSAPAADATWDDIMAMAKKLTLDKNGKNAEDPAFDSKNIVQWGLANYSTWIDGFVDPIANSYGEGLVSLDGSKSNLLGDSSKRTFQYLYDAIWKYHVAPDFDTVPAWTDIFAQGKCAIYPLASYLLYGYADESKGININYDVMQMPKGTTGKNFNPVQSKGICISPSSKNIPAAWEFTKFIASEENYKSVVSSGAGLSPIDSINKELFLTAKFGPKNTKQVYLDALQNPCPLWQTVRAGDANTKIGEISEYIMKNKVSVDEGLKKMDEAVQQILDDK